MFFIRADANQSIASGHVMRCMAIAKQIQLLGEPCTFIAADECARELIEAEGFSFYCLHSKWDAMDTELDALLSYIEIQSIKVLLIDSYSVTKDYLYTLRQHVYIVYLDDINKFYYSVDTIINYGIHYKMFQYEERYKTDTKLLLGCVYVPLRTEFNKIKPRNEQQIKKILITTGGTDPFNMASALIKKFIDRGYSFHIVSGRMNTHLKELYQLEEEYSRVKIHTNVKNMAELMNQCDLAVSAAGTTLYELMACGTPAVSFSFADNQILNAKELNEAGILIYAGDLRDGVECCLEKIRLYIEEMEQNPLKRFQQIEKMQKIVDGKGAMRIAKHCLTQIGD